MALVRIVPVLVPLTVVAPPPTSVTAASLGVGGAAPSKKLFLFRLGSTGGLAGVEDL